MNEKIASASYVVNLYYDVEYLNDYLPAYKSSLIDAEKQGRSPEDMIMLNEESKESLKKTISTIRFLMVRSWIKLSALKKTFPEFEQFIKDNKKRYDELIGSAVPDYEELTSYIIDLNTLFVNNIIKDVLMKVETIYSTYMDSMQQSTVQTPGENQNDLQPGN